MPLNGLGTYAPPGADFPAVTGAVISSSKFNNVINDIATALSTAMYRDGQAAMTGALNMNSQVINTVGAGSAAAPGLNFGSATGLYAPAAGQFGIAIGGVAAYTIDANRRHLIAAPISGPTLTVNGAVGATGIVDYYTNALLTGRVSGNSMEVLLQSPYTATSIIAWGGADVANSHYVRLRADSTTTRLESTKNGTGTNRDLEVYVGGVRVGRWLTTGGYSGDAPTSGTAFSLTYLAGATGLSLLRSADADNSDQALAIGTTTYGAHFGIRATAGAWNPGIAAGDFTILSRGTAVDTGALTIGSWSTAGKFLRMAATGAWTFGVGGSSGPAVTISGAAGQFQNNLTLQPSTHATSRRASLIIDDWTIGQDNSGNGTKDFFVYGNGANRISCTPSGNWTVLAPSSGVHTLRGGITFDDGGLVAAALSYGGQVAFGSNSSHPFLIVSAAATRMQFSTAGRIQFGTSGTQWEVDTSNRLLNPGNTQPSFLVASSAARTTAGTFTTYAGTRFNQGSMMNASTGVATAPVPGKYFWSFRIVGNTSSGTGTLNGGLKVNGASVTGTQFSTNILSTNQGLIYSASGVINLAASDAVRLDVDSIGGTGATCSVEGFSLAFLY